MGSEGGFMGLDYGRWISELKKKKSEKKNLKKKSEMKNFEHNFLLGLFCWEDACQQHTVQNIMGSRGWKKSKDCKSSRKKLWMRQGLKPWLQGEGPAPKPLNHKDLLKLRATFFHLAELATSEFLLNFQHSRRPKQTFLKYASLIFEPGATKLLLFFNSGPKKALSLSLDVKCDQQTHKKLFLQS